MPDLAITSAGRMDGDSVRVRLHQAARAFEMQFAQQLLKPLGENSMGGEESSDPGSQIFKGMLSDGLAEHAAGGLGIARIVEQTMLASMHARAARPEK